MFKRMKTNLACFIFDRSFTLMCLLMAISTWVYLVAFTDNFNTGLQYGSESNPLR